VSKTQTSLEPSQSPVVGGIETKLEVVVLPVSDVDRAKRFYAGLGWRLDADFAIEAIHGILDVMTAGASATTLRRSVPIHPTVSELIPTVLGDLVA